MSADPLAAPRAKRRPRAGRVPSPAAGSRCGNIAENEAVDFVIVGTGAGGGTLACKLAEAGFSVVALDAGPYFRPLEDFASDESEQTKLYWTDDRIVDGENPLQLGSNNSGKAVGGSTVHFAMVSLRFRPEWFKSRTALGYGADWPLDWREMWHYYAEVEEALKICGPGHLSLGPAAAALPLPRARAERRRARPGARLRGDGHPLDGDAARHAVRAARPGASLRLSRLLHHRLLHQRQAERAGHLDSARARRRRRDPRPRHGRPGRGQRRRPGDRRALPPRGALAVPEGAQRRGRRLCDRNAAPAAELRHDRFPDGLANSSGLVGKNLMVQSNQAVWGISKDERSGPTRGRRRSRSPSTGTTTTTRISSAATAT